MAIKTSFVNMDMTYPEAYLMIKKITVGNSEQEYFYNDSAGNEVLGFEKMQHAEAFVFVYADEVAKSNGVAPIFGFGVEFNYDPESGGNIYKEAYTAVKNTERLQNSYWKDV